MNRCFYLLIRLRPELRPKGKSQFELRTLNCRGTPDLPRDKPVVLAQARKPRTLNFNREECFVKMVGVLGLEPRTSRTRSVRHSQLGHTPSLKFRITKFEVRIIVNFNSVKNTY